MNITLALSVSLLTAPLSAHDGPQPELAEGETLEVQLNGDLNADGIPDVAYVAKTEDIRELRVLTSHVDQVNIGENAPQILALDPYPLVEATLELEDDRLVLSELTGGTTAIHSTHTFRWDPTMNAMRVIAIEATLYSRTFAHGAQEARWDLLTGIKVTRSLPLHRGSGDQAYDPGPERRTKKRSRPLRLEESPDGADVLGWPFGEAGRE